MFLSSRFGFGIKCEGLRMFRVHRLQLFWVMVFKGLLPSSLPSDGLP